MKRWLVGSLLVALAGVLLVIVINSNRDPIAVLEEFGALNEEFGTHTIERNETGEVVEVVLHDPNIPSDIRRLMHEIGLGPTTWFFGDAEMVHLKGLTKLQTLELFGSKVTDAGLVHLKGLTGLQTFYLGETQITDAGLVHLKGMAELQWLYLQRTKVTDQGVADLQKALPNCKIIK